MKRSKGFTLIELLVVISIIALLLSIVMPALKRVKEKAKATVCLTNFHQLGLAFSAYLQDYNNKFMGEWLSIELSGVQGGHDIWVEALGPYYGETDKILLCPSAVRTASEGARSPYKAWEVSDDSPYLGVAGKRGSYMINGWITNPYDYKAGKYRDNPRNWKTSLVQTSTSRIPVLGAGGAVWRATPDEGDRLPRWDGDEGFDAYCSMARFSLNRHEHGYTHMLFMDWSARPVGLKELWTLKWHRKFNTANKYTIAGGMTPDQWPEWMMGFKDF
jgi:prepilin-type N-terminal cleavage/methylation domain-containing protein